MPAAATLTRFAFPLHLLPATVLLARAPHGPACFDSQPASGRMSELQVTARASGPRPMNVGKTVLLLLVAAELTLHRLRTSFLPSGHCTWLFGSEPLLVSVGVCKGVLRTLGRCTRPAARPREPCWWHQLPLPPSSVRVTFRFSVRARLPITTLTLLEAMTSHCTSLVRGSLEVTTAPAHQHQSSHIEPVSRCTACCTAIDSTN